MRRKKGRERTEEAMKQVGEERERRNGGGGGIEMEKLHIEKTEKTQ
jgi:hypothetical protein